MVLYMTSVVYCRTFLHYMSSLFNNLKKTKKGLQHDVSKLELEASYQFPSQTNKLIFFSLVLDK